MLAPGVFVQDVVVGVLKSEVLSTQRVPLPVRLLRTCKPWA